MLERAYFVSKTERMFRPVDYGLKYSLELLTPILKTLSMIIIYLVQQLAQITDGPHLNGQKRVLGQLNVDSVSCTRVWDRESRHRRPSANTKGEFRDKPRISRLAI